MAEEKVLTFNDKSYSSDDLTKWTDRQKYLASQIQELQIQREERWRALDQTIGCIEFFTKQLIASLQNDEVKDGTD